MLSRPFITVLFAALLAGAIPAQGQTCTPSDTTLCLKDGRFSVKAEWENFSGVEGVGTLVPGFNDDSGLLWFFREDNWEMLVKMVDGCSNNGHFWVFAAATTNVEYTLTITDEATGVSRSYINPLGNSADAITDTQAFNTCMPAAQSGESRSTSSAVDLATFPGATTASQPPQRSGLARFQAKAACPEGDDELCLLGERFRAEVEWQNFSGEDGIGTVVPLSSPDSGLFWFFREDNWEMLVKMVDGCSNNDRFWVFAAATTNVAYTLRITDTLTGAVREYDNPLGTSAPAITDTQAFATCDGASGLPPDPGPANDLTLEGIDSDGDGIRDDVQRYIALTYPDSADTRNALRQVAAALQLSVLEGDDSQAAFENMSQLSRGIECLLGLHQESARRINGELLAEILDTEERGLAYFSFDAHLGGSVLPMRQPEEWLDSCAPPGSLFARQLSFPKGDAECATSDTKVYYANGVLTDPTGALMSMATLKLAMNQADPAGFSSVAFDRAYNSTSGKLADLWEAYKQEVDSNFSQFVLTILRLIPLPDFVRDRLVGLLAEISAEQLVTVEGLQGHVTSYRGDIAEGKKVVVVAHSQGNFFANQAYANLTSTERESFGIVSVATPDDTVAGGGPHTTLVEDLVIFAVYSIVGSLGPTVSNGVIVWLNDSTGHGFMSSYMVPGDPSRADIVDDVMDVRDGLQQPDQTAGQGLINVTLTWGAQPDIDLHAFEPNGAHVYYANQQGPSGELDLDDTNGMGPEHYTVSCETVEIGAYRIAVNYFRGTAPEEVWIKIDAGLEARTFHMVLPEERGFAGDNDPIPVANVNVIDNGDGTIRFFIEEL